MVAVGGVSVSVVDVIDVIVVWNSDVTASFSVGVVVAVVLGVFTRLALVEVAVVGAVQVSVVDVIDVITVRNSDVTASFTVSVVVTGVLLMGRSHRRLLRHMLMGRLAQSFAKRIPNIVGYA